MLQNDSFTPQHAPATAPTEAEWNNPFCGFNGTRLGFPSDEVQSVLSNIPSSFSVTEALRDYVVVDSACSYRHVFRSMSYFPNGVSSDHNVQLVDSNGCSTLAPGIGSAHVAFKTTSSSTVQMTFPDSVFNPNCPVNLLSVGALHRGKDGKPLDNEISFKSGTFTINVSSDTKRRTIPIEEKHGLFVIRLALLSATMLANQE